MAIKSPTLNLDEDKGRIVTNIRAMLREGYESGKLERQMNGHFFSGPNPAQNISERVTEILKPSDELYDAVANHLNRFDVNPKEKLEKLEQALKKGKKLDEFVNLGRLNAFAIIDYCPGCAQDITFASDGKTLKAQGIRGIETIEKQSDSIIPSDKPCEYPQQIEKYSLRLAVPSGKIVITEFLRQFFQEPSIYDIDRACYTTKAIILKAQFYEQQGLITGYVGNTCPSITQTLDSILIGRPAEGRKTLTDPLTKKLGKDRGQIITDGDSYSIADYDLLKKRNSKLLRSEEKHHGFNVLNVTPGIYTVTHFRKAVGERDSTEGQQVFVRIARKPAITKCYFGN